MTGILASRGALSDGLSEDHHSRENHRRVHSPCKARLNLPVEAKAVRQLPPHEHLIQELTSAGAAARSSLLSKPVMVGPAGGTGGAGGSPVLVLCSC